VGSPHSVGVVRCRRLSSSSSSSKHWSVAAATVETRQQSQAELRWKQRAWAAALQLHQQVPARRSHLRPPREISAADIRWRRQRLNSTFVRGSWTHTCYIHRAYIHTYIQTLDNAHNSQAQGLNLRRGRSLAGKRTVDINDEQTYGFLNEIRMSWNCWEIGWIAAKR